MARIITLGAGLAIAGMAIRSTAFGGFPGINGKIAFVSDRDGNTEIYVMNADGSNQVNITNNPAADFQPAWSPDGSKIAFVSDRDLPNSWDIYTMNPDGSEVVRLTSNNVLDWNPAWSPDGAKIAFASYQTGGGEILVMNADGTGVENLTNNPAYDRHPKWSPDGTKIAFETERGDNWEIYTMNTDGSQQTNVTNDDGYDFEPDWSPDGNRIAWRSNRAGDSGDVWVMDANGGNPINLTMSTDYDREPGWGPDNSKIAYASVHGSNFDIWTMNTDGTGKLAITSGSGNDYDPDWQASAGLLTLTVTKTGQGKVRSTPPGISCGDACSGSYAPGTVVTLRARPQRRWIFTGWTGPCSGTDDCVVTMDSSLTVTALFSREGSTAEIEQSWNKELVDMNSGIRLHAGLPATTMLYKNYPNPFNPSTTISYALIQGAFVSLTIYDMLGRPVATLVDEYQPSGYHAIVWNAADHSGAGVSSGMYVCRLIAGETVMMNRMLMLK